MGYDPERKLCQYFAFVEPPAVAFGQFVSVGYCNNTEGSFEVCLCTFHVRDSTCTSPVTSHVHTHVRAYENACCSTFTVWPDTPILIRNGR